MKSNKLDDGNKSGVYEFSISLVFHQLTAKQLDKSHLIKVDGKES